MKLRHFVCVLIAAVTAMEAPAEERSSPVAADATNATTRELKIDRTVAVQFPLVLSHDGITHGEARVLLNVDSDGRIADTLVIAYSHEPFATAALDAIRKWRYEPARINGEPVGTVAYCLFRFDAGRVQMFQRNGVPVFERQEVFGPALAYQPFVVDALDRIPTPQHVVAPVFPQEWADQGMRGDITVDFYIDETGKARMPSVASTTRPLLAAAAVAAVREWRFAPPLRKGRPVLAHCQQVFTFEPAPPER